MESDRLARSTSRPSRRLGTCSGPGTRGSRLVASPHRHQRFAWCESFARQPDLCSTICAVPIRVFISYTHDSDEHLGTVRTLAERLRCDGIDARLDQWVVGTPAQGWPGWMEDEIRAADFVIVVCSPPYYDRYRGEGDPIAGRGGRWESNLIRDHLYGDRSRLRRRMRAGTAQRYTVKVNPRSSPSQRHEVSYSA